MAVIGALIAGAIAVQWWPPSPVENPTKAPRPQPRQTAMAAVAPQPVHELAEPITTPERPTLALPASGTPTWLPALRTQARARGDRVADCMTSSNGPVELQWTATIAPSLGLATDHDLVLRSTGEAPDPDQYRCVYRVLGEPFDFGLVPPGEPQRVRLLLLL